MARCSDVIVTGSGTVSADDCSLTLSPVKPPRLRRLGKSDGGANAESCYRHQRQYPASANVVAGVTPTTLFTREGVSLDASMSDNVCQVPIPSSAAGLDLREVLLKLGEQGANEILVEAGPTLVGALEQENLIDQWLIYMAPVMLGSDARPTHHAVFNSLGQANLIQFRLTT